MDEDVKRRNTRKIVGLLEISGLLIVLLGGGVLWFTAIRGPATSAPTVTTDGTASIKLAWDKSPSQKVTGYKILSGTQPKSYTKSVDVGDESTVTLTNLKKGTKYYIVAVAVDAEGNQSPPSNEIEVVTPD